MPDADSLILLQLKLGYSFNSSARLEEALTHPSYLYDHPEAPASNQRLEFLGDAVLQVVLSHELFTLFPSGDEGTLTKRRSLLARGVFLGALAKEIGLDQCLRLGMSEAATGGRAKPSLLEDAFEALIGALYLDGGLEAARQTVLRIYGDLEGRLDAVESRDNPKGRLQERIQPEHGNQALQYQVLKIEGADHARSFEVQVSLQGRPLGRGCGLSKKLAEEAAAREALETLRGESPPCPPSPPPPASN
jgi:ribonuclease-3